MASAQLQKPTNGPPSHIQEENKISHKISEMTARVFGHKHQEHQTVTKHCSTCQCPPPKKDIKPARTDACTEIVKKEVHASTVNKNPKHNSCIEVKKKEKQHTTTTEAASATMKKKETKENHAKSNAANPGSAMVKKEHKGEAVNHFFSSMADQWKEKIKTMKKTKDGKSKYSSSSDSDSDDETCEKKKKDKKHHKEIKATSK